MDKKIINKNNLTLKNIYFKDGSSVNEGELIMSLDQQTLQQELNAAKALLKAEENGLEFLKIRFQQDGSHFKRIDSAISSCFFWSSSSKSTSSLSESFFLSTAYTTAFFTSL